MHIVLADHHEQPRLALDVLLKKHPEYGLIGDAVDAKGLLILAEEYSADLVLMDADLPGSPIEEVIARLHTLLPRPIVIVMSSKIECSRLSLKSGADAFVSKGDQPDWLLETLDTYLKRENSRGMTE